MLWIASWILSLIYLTLPAGAMVVVFWGNPKCRQCRRSVIFTFLTGSFLGGGLISAYALGTGASASPFQILLACDLGVGLILLLKLFDGILIYCIGFLLNVHKTGARGWRVTFGVLLRLALFVVIALPWIMSAAMSYRPRVVSRDNPLNTLGYPYENVTFNSVDGKRLSGWFIPSLGHPSDQTVLICHGLGASKSNFMPMAREFVPNGFNVFIFDFRAHGESDGQITSFGDIEQNDVLGAIQFLKSEKPKFAMAVHGLGASMGGAALIAAASRDNPTARQIDTIAILDSYSSLPTLADSICDYHMLPPMRQLLRAFGLWMCSLHSGMNLNHFAPADHIDQIWPRPVLIVHGVKDVMIPFEQGQTLYQNASEPKKFIPVEAGDHNSVINDDNVLHKVRLFFEHAVSVPVI